MFILILCVFLLGLIVGLYANLTEKEQAISRFTQKALAEYEAPVTEKKYCTLNSTFSVH